MRKRRVNALICIGCIFFVHMMAAYIPIIKNLYQKGFISETQLNENYITGDYHSLMSYAVIGTLLYMLYITYVHDGSKLCHVIRYKTRDAYLQWMLEDVMKATIGYVVLYQIMGIGFIIFNGSPNILMQHNWIIGIVLQSFICIIFYMSNFVGYVILKRVLNKTQSLVAVILINTLSYYIMLIFFPDTWVPIKDLEMVRNVCTNSISTQQGILAVIRWGMIGIMLTIFIMKMNRRDDIYG